jgi:hypothetical protein
MVAAPEVDLPEVDAVAQHRQDGQVVPPPAGAGAVAAVIQPAGDGLGAQPLVDVQVEDDWDQRRLLRMWHEIVGGRVDLVAEGSVAAAPGAAGGLALHPGNDPVDDGGPLELSERPEDLDEHAAHWGGGVEVLADRAERHPGPVELVQDLQQAPEGAGDAVDAVDQQHVKAPGAGVPQAGLEPGPVQGGAAHVVGVGAHQLPVVLALDVGLQLGVLGFDGERLVRLVERAAGEGGHPNGHPSASFRGGVGRLGADGWARRAPVGLVVKRAKGGPRR